MRTYPYQGWVLQPSFKPVEITIEANNSHWGGEYWDRTSSGKLVNQANVYMTKKAAIAGLMSKEREAECAG